MLGSVGPTWARTRRDFHQKGASKNSNSPVGCRSMLEVDQMGFSTKRRGSLIGCAA